jgi:DNA-binding PadR family transcriptional regulator
MTPVFRHGRLRLYLLRLLDEEPRHGYEVIRLLRDRFMGVYAPSPGTIYPRLARLEEEGLVTHDEEHGRKVYRITEAGREELRKRGSELDELEQELSASVSDIVREVKEDVRETVRTLREELTKAAREMRNATEAARATGASATPASSATGTGSTSGAGSTSGTGTASGTGRASGWSATSASGTAAYAPSSPADADPWAAAAADSTVPDSTVPDSVVPDSVVPDSVVGEDSGPATDPRDVPGQGAEGVPGDKGTPGADSRSARDAWEPGRGPGQGRQPLGSAWAQAREQARALRDQARQHAREHARQAREDTLGHAAQRLREEASTLREARDRFLASHQSAAYTGSGAPGEERGGWHSWADWGSWGDWAGRKSWPGPGPHDMAAFRDLERLTRGFANDLRKVAWDSDALGGDVLTNLRGILDDALDRIKTEVFGTPPSSPRANREPGAGHPPKPDPGPRQ